MQVDLRVQDTNLLEVFRGYIERKVRFGGQVGHVDVKVSNDSRASAVKNCHIFAEIKPFGWVSIRENGTDLHAVIDRAIGRLGRAFSRRLARAQELRFGRETVRAA
jgi:ribosome-associated translation inhibitor RaiA